MKPTTLLVLIVIAAVCVALRSENWTVSGVAGGVALLAFVVLVLLEALGVDEDDATADR